MGKYVRLIMFAILGIFVLSACQSPAPATPTPVRVEDVVATMIAQSTATAVPPISTLDAQPTPVPVLPTLEVKSTAAPAVAPVVDTPAGCVAEARFVEDVTVPDLELIEPGRSFVKTWRLLNTGTCPWTGDYRLVFQAGDPLGTETSVALPVVPPQSSADVSVSMTAPVSGGVYTSFWRIVNQEGATVALRGADNPRIWVTIQVPVRVAAAQVEDVPVTGPGDKTTSPQPVNPPAVPPAAPVVDPAQVKPPANCQSQVDTAYTRRLIDLMNNERTSRGLPALRVDEQLTLAALDHTLDMTCNNFVEHYGTDGSTWFTRIQARGYSYKAAYENVAAGNPAVGGTPEWVVSILWMNSQVHRENILNPSVTDIGVAFMTNPSARFVGYTTVNFATKP